MGKKHTLPLQWIFLFSGFSFKRFSCHVAKHWMTGGPLQWHGLTHEKGYEHIYVVIGTQMCMLERVSFCPVEKKSSKLTFKFIFRKQPLILSLKMTVEREKEKKYICSLNFVYIFYLFQYSVLKFHTFLLEEHRSILKSSKLIGKRIFLMKKSKKYLSTVNDIFSYNS